MHLPVVEFLLVPDKSAARRVRRGLAERGARIDVVVGTWPELLELAAHCYLIPVDAIDAFDAVFRERLHQHPDAFWSKSLEAAEDETLQAVRRALYDVISGTVPTGWRDTDVSTSLAGRRRKRISDLIELARSLDGALPGDLQQIGALLDSDRNSAMKTVRVHCAEKRPWLNRWQRALGEKFRG